MRRKSWIFMTLSLSAAVMLLVSCAPRGRGWDRERERMGNEPAVQQTLPDILLLDLYLTPEQAARITALREDLIREIRPLQEQMVKERSLMQQQYGAGPTRDNGVIESAAMSIQLLAQAIKGSRARYLQAVVQVLTPEQNAILRSLARGSEGGAVRGSGADAEEGPGGRMGGRGGMGGPGGGGMGGPGGGGRQGGGW